MHSVTEKSPCVPIQFEVTADKLLDVSLMSESDVQCLIELAQRQAYERTQLYRAMAMGADMFLSNSLDTSHARVYNTRTI